MTRFSFKYARHKSILKRLTPHRILNCLRLAAELKTRKKQLVSYPVIARINTYPHCQLECPACQVMRSSNTNRTEWILELDQYKLILDQMAKHLLLVVLYDEGEPLLHPDLPEIISYTSSHNVATSISTNLAMALSDDYISRLVRSGLDRMTVSMDGSTQETYGKYRIGGDLETVKQNMRRVAAMNRKCNSPLHLEVQFLRFGFNDHEAEGVKRFAAEAGADSFRALPTSIHGLESYLEQTGGTLSEGMHLKIGCLDLWSIAHISSDGMIFPCDFGEDHSMPPLGSLLENDFELLWNSQRMQDLRAGFAKSKNRISHATCNRCPSANRTPLFLQ